MKDYYQIIGVSRTAGPDEIKKAYRKLAMRFHPDRWVNGTDAEKKQAEVQMKELNEAYETLSDPNKRSNYDWLLWKSGQKDSSGSSNSQAGSPGGSGSRGTSPGGSSGGTGSRGASYGGSTGGTGSRGTSSSSSSGGTGSRGTFSNGSSGGTGSRGTSSSSSSGGTGSRGTSSNGSSGGTGSRGASYGGSTGGTGSRGTSSSGSSGGTGSRGTSSNGSSGGTGSRGTSSSGSSGGTDNDGGEIIDMIKMILGFVIIIGLVVLIMQAIITKDMDKSVEPGHNPNEPIEQMDERMNSPQPTIMIDHTKEISELQSGIEKQLKALRLQKERNGQLNPALIQSVNDKINRLDRLDRETAKTYHKSLYAIINE